MKRLLKIALIVIGILAIISIILFVISYVNFGADVLHYRTSNMIYVTSQSYITHRTIAKAS